MTIIQRPVVSLLGHLVRQAGKAAHLSCQAMQVKAKKN